MSTETYTLELRSKAFVGGSVKFEYAPDATVGELLSAACEDTYNTGLLRWNGLVAVDSDTCIVDAQFVTGEEVEPYVITEQQRQPLVNQEEAFRVVLLNGRQLGFGWPLEIGGSISLGLDGEHWITCEPALAQLLVACSDEGIISLRTELDGEIRTTQDDQIFESYGIEMVFRFAIISRDEHEDARGVDGRVGYRVSSRQDLSIPPDGRVRHISPHPSVDPPVFPLLETVLQSAPMLAMALVFIFFTESPFALASLLLVLALPIMQVIRHNREVRRMARKLDEWALEAENLAGRVRALAQLEAEAIVRRCVPLPILAFNATRRADLLWTRDAASGDFLNIEIGKGNYRSGYFVDYDGIRNIDHDWEAFFSAARVVPGVPIECSLNGRNFGIVGRGASSTTMAEQMLLSLVLSHAPSSVAILTFLPRASAALDWLRRCPHSAMASLGWVGDTLLRGRAASADALSANLGFGASIASQDRNVLIVAHESSGVSVAALREYIDSSASHCSVLWIGSSSRSFPTFVDRWMAIDGEIATLLPQNEELALSSPLAAETRDEAIEGVHPLLDDGALASALSLPVEVAIGQLIDLDNVWTHDSSHSLIVRNTVSARGPVGIDIADAGPHLLAAGMTGSGKSEYVRSLVLSLAAEYSPKELRFLLVDYKGGASLGQFRHLPHTIGMVTSLGELDVMRLVKYLNRELVRRQEILAAFEGEYRTYRERTPVGYMPRLMIVIDEFQGFVQSGSGNSEKMSKADAILNVAARGRSAGVHLLIATQNPTGDVVSPSVQANIGLTVALKTADKRGSINLLGSPVASSIPQVARGRLYMRTDGTELQLLQSAYTQSRYLATRATGMRIRISSTASQAATRHSDKPDTDAVIVRDALIHRWAIESETPS